jgi:hypothetical protein
VLAVARAYDLDPKTLHSWRQRGQYHARRPASGRGGELLAPFATWLGACAPEVGFNAVVPHQELRLGPIARRCAVERPPFLCIAVLKEAHRVPRRFESLERRDRALDSGRSALAPASKTTRAQRGFRPSFVADRWDKEQAPDLRRYNRHRHCCRAVLPIRSGGASALSSRDVTCRVVRRLLRG